MFGALLRRVGFWLIVAAILVAVSPAVLGESGQGLLAQGMDLAGPLAVIGVALAVLGWLAESLGLSGKRCQRCSRLASHNSVFCNAHRSELSRASREATDHFRREHRSY